jgi:UDP-N-acetylmuramyl pentapeptide phosphotransferase/UDP-N-acetylglucosamine-1-phosphate transferase
VHQGPFVAVVAENGWLVAFTAAGLVVLLGGTVARRIARRTSNRRRGRSAGSTLALRRRAGCLVMLGPIIGLLAAGSADTETVVVVLAGAALAAFGIAVERWQAVDRLVVVAVLVAAVVAVIAGVDFGPTGVDALDTACAVAFIVVVTLAFDGFGNADGLVCGVGAAAAAALFALAAFGNQDPAAAVMAGLGGAVIAFLAFNTRPASLFIGRAGRLSMGYVLAASALVIRPVPGPWRSLTVPLILFGVPLLDAVIVVGDRLGRRRALAERRADHLAHRLRALRWSSSEVVVTLVVAQAVLGGVALFVGRGVLSVWIGVAIAALVIGVFAVEAARAEIERDPPEGLSRRARIVLLVLVVALIALATPIALVANDARELMEKGRSAATRALSAARDGDAITAQGNFREAALTFARARDRIESPLAAGGLAVPFLASNVRAARELSEIGIDLAQTGEDVTAAVHPEALEVIDGRLPLDEVRRVTPALESGSHALDRSLARLKDVEAEPYLVSPVRDALAKIDRELSRAASEARRAAVAAQLAPAIFGGNGPRVYLLVVQNNAESRATGGFIGSYGLLSADNGKLHVSRLLRTAVWNSAVRANTDPKADEPADYRRRYGQFQPERTLQNVNLSPDFPSVARVLMSQAPEAGLPPVDGVLAVDPVGLSALLQLTGPVSVEGWPTEISSSDVVNVTLRDAYAAFADTPERADFLGNVAQAAVDKATSGSLGKPANIAKVLGGSAHEGHLILAFRRPEEQRLARELGVAGQVEPVHSDAIAVTSSNAAGNKIDYYLKRQVGYRIALDPQDMNGTARASGELTVRLDNTAPANGLPEAVIGPFLPDRFVAGENLAYVSLYSPLAIKGASVDGQAVNAGTSIERGRNVYSLFASVLANSSTTISARLNGQVHLHDGWYEVAIGHQPTLEPDRVHVSIEVPQGWRIAEAPKLQRPAAREAVGSFVLNKPTTVRVRLAHDYGDLDLWNRLRAGV